MQKLWVFLYKLSKRKLKDAHMKKFRSDIKCPQCKRWFSETSIFHKHEHVSEPTFGFHLKCGACEGESFWNAEIAPVLIRCNENGIPY